MYAKLKSPKLFYGWWIVAACFLIATYVGGVIFYGFTTIFEPIANEFGWSYAQISFAASLRGLEMSIMAPLVGILVDRLGPKRLVFGGAVLTTVGLVLLSRVSSLAGFYGAFLLVALGMSGCSMTVLVSSVANWFRRKVGIASGIAISGFGAGGLLVPLMVRLIDLYGWRMTVLMLAMVMLVLVLPLSFFFRHRPEQYGYLPDGEASNEVLPGEAVPVTPADESSVGTGQVIRSGTFWRLVMAFTFHVTAVGAASTHVMPYLSSIGVARSTSAVVATFVPLMSIAGRLGFGWLSDRLTRRYVAGAALAMIGLGLLAFGYVMSTTWLLIPYLILFGIGFGGSNVMRMGLTREYFGSTRFGTIFGLMIGISMLGNMIGPPLAGWVYDYYGNYQGIWLALAGLAVVAVVAVLTVTPMQISKIESN